MVKYLDLFLFFIQNNKYIFVIKILLRLVFIENCLYFWIYNEREEMESQIYSFLN